MPLDEFWIKMRAEYDELSQNALRILLNFTSTYLCETSFSAMTVIKTKYRNRLSAENAMRIAISTIEPQIVKLVQEVNTQHLDSNQDV